MKETSKFKVGDRVRIVRRVSDNNDLVEGMAGVVCDLDKANPSVGVSFDHYRLGHNCSGTAADGHGWYVGEKELAHDKLGTIKWFYEAVQSR